jgi:hypothetical protein
MIGMEHKSERILDSSGSFVPSSSGLINTKRELHHGKIFYRHRLVCLVSLGYTMPVIVKGPNYNTAPLPIGCDGSKV